MNRRRRSTRHAGPSSASCSTACCASIASWSWPHTTRSSQGSSRRGSCGSGMVSSLSEHKGHKGHKEYEAYRQPEKLCVLCVLCVLSVLERNHLRDGMRNEVVPGRVGVPVIGLQIEMAERLNRKKNRLAVG